MRSSKTKRHMFLILLLLLALTGIVYIGTESFQIRKVTIMGNEKVEASAIIKRSGIIYDQNIFKLDKQLIRQRIETDPYLEVASITVSYPNEVIIKVIEREAAAIIPYLNSYFIIDKECYILEITKDIQDIQYPLIQDVHLKSFLVGKKMVAAEEYQLKVLSKILESIYLLGLQNQVSEIMMANSDDVYLMLTDGIQVRIGQAVEMDKKLLWLGSQEIKEVCKGIIGGILDLSAASQPVFYPEES